MKIKFLGQSGFRLTLECGSVVVTDPWLGWSPIKSYETPVKWREFGRCDAMLVSHDHPDHLDDAALRVAKQAGSEFIGSERAARRARRAGVKKVTVVKAGDSLKVGGALVHAVPAFHPLAPDAVGFAIEDGVNVYFSGDTRYEKELVDDLKKYRIDVALLQVTCLEYFFRKDGLDFEDAARLAAEVGAGVVIPMHYHDIVRKVAPEEMRRRFEALNVKVDVMEVGEGREYRIKRKEKGGGWQ